MQYERLLVCELYLKQTQSLILWKVLWSAYLISSLLRVAYNHGYRNWQMTKEELHY